MAGPERYGSRMLVRLAGGIVLAASVAAGVFVAAGGAGEDGRAGWLVVLTILAVAALLLLIAPAIGARGSQATPGTRGWTQGAGTGQPLPVSSPAAQEPSRWPGPAAPPRPRWPEARGGARARTGPRAGSRTTSGRSPAALFGLGIVAVVVMVLSLGSLWRDDLSDEEQATVILITVLLTAVPCLLAGFVAGGRRRGLETASWLEHTAGVVAGVVGLWVILVMTIDSGGEDASSLLLGLLVLGVPVSTVAFVFGLTMWRMATGARRRAGIPGVGNRVPGVRS